MLLTSSTYRLSRILLKSAKLSWRKYEYFQSWCLKLQRSSSYVLVDKADTCRNQDAEQHFIQPDIAGEVSRTLKENQVKRPPFLKAPGLKDSLQKRDHANVGQPTPYTHPHFFDSDDEATPGIKHEEYALRRHRLMRVLSQTSFGKNFEDHVVLLSASTLKTMTNDIPYPFHQDVDFLYLTGVNEPDAMLAIEYNKTSERTRFLLFVKPTDPKRVLWDGPVIGESAAVAYFKADEAFPLSSFQSVIKGRYGNGRHCIWYKRDDKKNMRNDTTILDVINAQGFRKVGHHAIEYNLQLLRLIKSDAEARIMKKSASIAAEAFTKVIQNTKIGIPESHLHALLEFECKTRGAQYLSFPPVVAGGEHANILHYINNSDILNNNDLVLMDGGCEFNAYASDITRTWPINGKFSPVQKELYQIVLDVQKKCLTECKPGVSLDQLYQIMLLTLGKLLQDIGFISNNESENELKRSATKYCPHHLGHYLGMDTHDTPLIHRGLPLQAGMAFTLEPGLYISENATHIPKKYRGIGIRIEDDILLTNNGPYVLTAQLPKEINDLETLLISDENT